MARGVDTTFSFLILLSIFKVSVLLGSGDFSDELKSENDDKKVQSITFGDNSTEVFGGSMTHGHQGQKYEINLKLSDRQTVKVKTEVKNALDPSPAISVIARQKDNEAEVVSFEVPPRTFIQNNFYTITLCREIIKYLIDDKKKNNIMEENEINGSGNVPENEENMKVMNETEEPEEIKNVTMSLEVYPVNIKNQSIQYEITMEIIDMMIDIETPKIVKVSPTSPAVFKFMFPPEMEDDNLLLNVTSNLDEKTVCSIVSIQKILNNTSEQCPFNDVEKNIKFGSHHFTMLQQGFLNMSKNTFPNGAYIVILPKSDDKDCNTIGGNDQPENNKREMTITVTIQEDIPTLSMTNSMILILSLYFIFGLLALSVSKTFMYSSVGILYRHKGLLAQKSLDLTSVSTIEEPATEKEANSVPNGSEENTNNMQKGKTLHRSQKFKMAKAKKPFIFPWQDEKSQSKYIPEDNNKEDSTDSKKNCTNENMLIEERDIILKNHKSPKVSDLSKMFENLDYWSSTKAMRSSMFAWMTLLMGLFYILPALQLVIGLQNSSLTTGNMDMCFFNHLCLYSLGPIYDFSHVFSNFPYFISGVSFLFIVWHRSFQYTQLRRKFENDDDVSPHTCGIPEQYGIFYGLGFCLIMESILSSIYHVCPTDQNFQFDTTFMYVMSFLFFLKVYQFRHPDITVKAIDVFLVLALILILVVISIYWHHILFRTIFVCCYIVLLAHFQVQLYYNGSNRWKKAMHALRNIVKNIRRENTAHKVKLILNLLVLTVNIVLAVGYISQNSESNLSSFMLLILLSNLFIYIIFYLCFKLYYRFRPTNWCMGESFNTMSLIYFFISCVTMGIALSFFNHKLKATTATPAESRDINESCYLWVFDHHDMWHFFSATALFYFCMFLLTLEDANIAVRREIIPVF